MLHMNPQRSSALRDEGGSALVAVIGVLAVSLIVTMVVAASVVHALGFTTATRANVQSQAAAEAGIAVAQASLLNGTCTTGVYTSTDPQYTVAVSYVTGGVLTVGCPPNNATEIRIVANGSAATPGVGMTMGDESTVEAIYQAPASGVPASGAAIYAYSAIGFGGSGHLVSTDGHETTVHLQTDTLVCNGGAGIDASVVVANGNVEIGGSCPIGGSVWVGGNVKLSGNPVVSGGQIVASGDADVVGTHTVDVWAGGNLTKGYGTVTGTLVAGGNLNLVAELKGAAWSGGNLVKGYGTVTGNLISAGTVRIEGATNGNIWATGTVTRASHPTVNGSIVGSALINNGNHNGTFYTYPAGPARPLAPATPPIPTVPDWIDFAQTMDHWPGYTLATISGNCDFAKIQAALNTFGGNPGVIDARGCTNPFSILGSFKLDLKNDTAIIANKFKLSEGGGFTADNPVSLWLITPDDVPDGVPTCTPAKNQFELSGGFSFDSDIKTLAYTPCRVSIINTGLTIRGQIFAGATTIDGAATLDFSPVGLPGYDLSTGGPTGGGTGTIEDVLSHLIAMRNTSSD